MLEYEIGGELELKVGSFSEFVQLQVLPMASVFAPLYP